MEVDTAAIEAEVASLRGHGNEVIIERRYPRLAHTHQLDIPTGHLLLRLDKIAAIRKKRGAVLRHHQISLTAESGQEADRTEVHADILAQVKIIRRYQVGIDVILLHLLTQSIQCCIHFSTPFISFYYGLHSFLYFSLVYHFSHGDGSGGRWNRHFV